MLNDMHTFQRVFFVFVVSFFLALSAVLPNKANALNRSDAPFPAPWKTWEFLEPNKNTVAADQYQISPDGNTFSLQSDWSSMVYQQQQCENYMNNFDIVARVVSEGTAASGSANFTAKAGLTARTSLTNATPFNNEIMLTTQPDSSDPSKLRVNFTIPGFSPYYWVTSNVNGFPIWLKLKKRGRDVTASYSADGQTWTDMPGTLPLGLSGTSTVSFGVFTYNLSQMYYTASRPLATATFDNVAVMTFCSLTEPTASPTLTPSQPTNTPVVTQPQECVGDINGDLAVTIIDYGLLKADFLKIPPTNPKSNLNGKGNVDLADYLVLVRHIFKPCSSI